MPLSDLIMLVNGTPWYEFIGELDANAVGSQDFSLTFKDAHLKAGETYKIGFYAVAEGTSATVGGMLSNKIIKL